MELVTLSASSGRASLPSYAEFLSASPSSARNAPVEFVVQNRSACASLDASRATGTDCSLCQAMPQTQEVLKTPSFSEPLALRVPDACNYIGISRSSLYNLIAKGEIEIVKLGASTLVLTESLKTLIESRRLSKPENATRSELCEAPRH